MRVKPDHPLVVCLKLCQAMGEPGRIVWELGKLYTERKKKPYTQEQRLDYLKTALNYLREKAAEEARVGHKFEEGYWKTLPVDFQTFVESPEMMNKMSILWPEVMKCGLELNSGKYIECVLTGSIGVAKSTLAIYTQAYQAYLLSCMANPHEVFDLDTSSEILIVFQSVNKQVATDVDYKRLRDMFDNSPYFTKFFPFDKDRESEIRFPNRIIIRPVAGHDTAAIGQNVIGAILDELNFMAVTENSKQTKDGGLYDQAMENYNSISSRRMSRFASLGALPGMLCLVSSRNYPGQFTDLKEEEAKTNKQIYIYDKRVWEIRPEKFSFHLGERSPTLQEQWGENYPFWFRMFVGDATRKPRMLGDNEKVPEKDDHLVMNIPIEYKQLFINNPLKALRDQAGLATQALHPFMMNTDAIAAAFGHVKHVISREVCDFEDLKVRVYPNRILAPQHPRFAHIDMSKSKDSTGIAVGHVPAFVAVNRGDVVEMLPVIVFDVLLEVRPPKGGEIVPENLRRLFYGLRTAGMPLKWITSDTYQSMDNLQILRQQGFQTGTCSVDEETLPYDTLKQAIYDGRVRAPVQAKCQKELTRLELNPKTMKVDHPGNGSKDVSDAMAGVCYGLTQRREIWARHGVRTQTMTVDQAKRSGIKAETPNSYIEMLRKQKGESRLIDRKLEEMAGDQLPFLVRPQPTNLRDRLK
jgi:hypothetical protein